MKIPLSWLRHYLKTPLSPEQIENALTLGGIEIEKIEKTGGSFSGIVVATVTQAVPHPEADRLQIATVFDGKEYYQVVCGGKNCRTGLKTAFAPIGATLLDEEGKVFKIKKGKIRNVESFGMLCSKKELHLAKDDEGGIIECDPLLPEGTDFSSLYTDYIFHISLTPNLGHCMSAIGIARELSALLNIPLTSHTYSVSEDPSLPIEKKIDVEIQDAAHCKRYACRIIQDIAVGPSPEKIKQLIESSGMKSINNVVDIANLVMLELGQPLHIFDYDSLIEKKIIVKLTAEETPFVGLDEVTRNLSEGTLIISDGKRPLAIAGVLGSLDSSVNENTKNILIEAACFSPSIVRKMMKSLGLRTEAAIRFEKGIDIEGVPTALDYAAQLIKEFAGGTVNKGMVDKLGSVRPPVEIRCRTSHVNKILGTQLATSEIAGILGRLDIAILQEMKDLLVVEPPSYRNDLISEIDLIEEVARIYGYNTIPRKVPSHISSSMTHAPAYEIEKRARDALLQEGLQECITCDLTSPKLAELCLEKSLGEDNLIRVLHPSSIDQSVLRSTLLPCLLEVARLNQDHQNEDLSLFEVGRIHFKQKEEFVEQAVAGVLLTGSRVPYHWDPKPSEVDFFDLKGIVENFFSFLGIRDISFEPSHLENFHPFRQAKIKQGDMLVGVLGEVHPAHRKVLGLKRRIYFAEVNLQALLPFLAKVIAYVPHSIYPGTERDWTITLNKAVTFKSLMESIANIPSRLLEKVSLVDIYTSKELGENQKNVTLRFLYRDKEKTIAFEAAEKEHERIVSFATEKITLLNKTTEVT